jgi:hypothetical protein
VSIPSLFQSPIMGSQCLAAAPKPNAEFTAELSGTLSTTRPPATTFSATLSDDCEVISTAPLVAVTPL